MDWHLRVLGGAGLIVSVRSGRFRRYYPNKRPWSGNVARFAFLQSPKTHRLAALVIQTPGQTLTEIEAQLPPDERGGLDALRYQLRRFVHRGLVQSMRRGSRNLYRPSSELLRIVETLDAFRPTLNQPNPTHLGVLPRPTSPPPTPGATPSSASPLEA